MLHLNRRQLFVTAAAAGVLPGCSRTSNRAAIGAWGIDLAARDLSIKPGDDFFQYACGTWLQNTEIPGDRISWGSFDILAEKAERDVKAVIEETAQAGGALGSNEQKIADFYNAYLDQEAINTAGLAPAQPDLDRIATMRNMQDVVAIMGAPDLPVGAPISLGVTLDDRNPDRFVVGMRHSGLSLPDRDYYLSNDEEMRTLRTQFQTHIERMFNAAGLPNGAANASAILAFQTEIARRHWTNTERRDVERLYNMRTRDQVKALAPNFPWDAYMAAAEFTQVNDILVGELSAMGPLAQLMTATPIETWRAYFTYNYLNNNAPVLPKPIDDESFAFYGEILSGQPGQMERWRRGIYSVNGALGKAVGQLYVRKHFTPEAKAQMLELIENMRRAYGERIDQLSWMSAETKVAAREKLATFMPKIGYPDTWRDYSDFEVRAGDAFGNRKRGNVYARRYDAARLNRPSDKTEWLFINPQEVNAYYSAPYNEIVFPAAILQPPFFDPNADPAVNYGGIGGVIGHEMGHGFDDQGSKSDAHGVLRDWWNANDVTAFSNLTRALATQYSGFEALPGLNVKGDLTLGENIGDNGGLQVAYYAYQLSLNGQPAPNLDEVTGDQRFFLGWAQIWREKMRGETLRNVVLSDVHAPSKFRVNGTVRNMDSWYAAYDVQPSDALYLAEDQRIEIW
jgi:putative endopeptidase